MENYSIVTRNNKVCKLWPVVSGQQNTKTRRDTIQAQPIIIVPDLIDFFGDD